jgi:hypothetical protein
VILRVEARIGLVPVSVFKSIRVSRIEVTQASES